MENLQKDEYRENFFKALGEMGSGDIDELSVLDIEKENISILNKQIECLGIPVIREYSEVIANGFIIGVSSINNIKHLINDGSICVYFSQVVSVGDYSGDISNFIGKEKIIEIYIRLGETNTWIKYKPMLLVSCYLEIFFKDNEEDDDDDYDDYDDEEEEIDYDRLNKLAVIVAKSNGFNLLKNRDQRKMFAGEVLSKTSESFSEYELFNVAATAETFYDLGILPTEAKKLHLDGKTDQEIAKLLGHTKARIEKALRCDVSDKIRGYIE